MRYEYTHTHTHTDKKNPRSFGCGGFLIEI